MQSSEETGSLFAGGGRDFSPARQADRGRRSGLSRRQKNHPRNLQIAELWLARVKQAEIARRVGCSLSTVERTIARFRRGGR